MRDLKMGLGGIWLPVQGGSRVLGRVVGNTGPAHTLNDRGKLRLCPIKGPNSAIEWGWIQEG